MNVGAIYKQLDGIDNKLEFLNDKRNYLYMTNDIGSIGLKLDKINKFYYKLKLKQAHLLESLETIRLYMENKSHGKI